MRRDVTLALAVAAALLFPKLSSAQSDIVVIMTDDLDSQMLDDLVSRGFMPNLKSRIIDQGAALSSYFITDPFCAPSRATMLTGRYPHNHGVKGNGLPIGGASKLDDSQTLATWLTTAGYRTSLIGKYINGYGVDLPDTYVPPGWADWHAVIHSVSDETRYYLNENGVVLPYGFSDAEYPTDVFAARAESFISTTTSPYFLYINSLAPHTERHSPQCNANDGPQEQSPPATRHLGLAAEVPLPQGAAFNESDVSDKPAWWQARYPVMTQENVDCMQTAYRAGMESMMAVDELIGRVFAATDLKGTTANTIFVFTSDNGFLYGQHRGREKESIYEESIRAPMYVVGPGIGVQNVTVPVLNNDFAPTVCEWAGALPTITVDGRSFVPLLTGSPLWRNRFLAEHYEEEKPAWYMIRIGARGRLAKYAYYDATTDELYDLLADPAEMVSKHADGQYAKIRKYMRKQLKLIVGCEGAECMALEDTP